jgi:2-methylisocitrate lyase-like PEP mutase family enzyme
MDCLDAALAHARLYREAGADVLFVEAPQPEAEIRAIAAAFPDVPLLFNYAEGRKTPAIDHKPLAELGFAIVIFPISTMLAATRSMCEVLARIKQDGSPVNVLAELPAFNDFLDLTGLPEVRRSSNGTETIARKSANRRHDRQDKGGPWLLTV